MGQQCGSGACEKQAPTAEGHRRRDRKREIGRTSVNRGQKDKQAFARQMDYGEDFRQRGLRELGPKGLNSPGKSQMPEVGSEARTQG